MGRLSQAEVSCAVVKSHRGRALDGRLESRMSRNREAQRSSKVEVIIWGRRAGVVGVEKGGTPSRRG